LPGDYLTGRTVTKEKRRTIQQLGFAEGRNLALAQRKQLVALIPAVPQSKLEADTPWFLDDDCPASILWDVRQAENWLDVLADAEQVTAVYIVTAENRLFNTIKEQVQETLGPLLVEEEEKRPLAEGFPANLDYFKLDFLQPADIQMGRQFAAILPMLWMMAGAKGKRPEPPAPSAPWLIPTDCPFAVLLQETRFKDFYRHIMARSDLTHAFIVTNSRETYYQLRDELGTLTVVQLYKDYLENFRINLPENL
jgi:adenine-specific DNA-methyltransferase